MYNFLSVIKGSNPFVDNYILPKIKDLLDRYKNVLEDDYTTGCFEEFLSKISPHLYAGFQDGRFMGFVYLSDWKGGKGEFHSCIVTVCVDRKFRGKPAREAGKIFVDKIFKYYNLYKMKALVFENNINVINFLASLGFKKEGILEGETFKHNKPVNLLVYSVFNKTYRRNHNGKK